jgi:SAM-dependent methyltransferase
METRLEREQRFFDAAPEEDRRALGKYYELARSSAAAYDGLLQVLTPGSRVLELGCGDGTSAIELAGWGAEVDAIDISPAGVEEARLRTAEQGVERARFHVMDAEQLAFDDGSFDLVCGRAILHHLDLERVLPELGRTLAPAGRLVFIEPLGHNPAINLFRSRTPGLRTPDEHPLLMRDLALVRSLFDDVELRFFHLTSFAALPCRRFSWHERLLHGLEALDARLLRLRPLRRYAWRVLISASATRRPAGTPAGSR